MNDLEPDPSTEKTTPGLFHLVWTLFGPGSPQRNHRATAPAESLAGSLRHPARSFPPARDRRVAWGSLQSGLLRCSEHPHSPRFGSSETSWEIWCFIRMRMLGSSFWSLLLAQQARPRTKMRRIRRPRFSSHRLTVGVGQIVAPARTRCCVQDFVVEV